MADVTLSRLTKSFGNVDVLHGIDLSIASREFVVFVGPSGCGKSTLLRMIAGLEEISSGDLMIDGVRANDLQPVERGTSMVFQSYALYPHMTVAENMTFGLRMAKMPKADIARRLAEAARILQLEPLLDRRPRQLSGGQRQRVAIGRCIVRDPKVFLFDEPLSNLDTALRVQMRIEIARLHRELNATMVYVTHDQVEAMTLADKIVVLRAGRIEQVGAPLDLYHAPANKFVAGFIGSPAMNFIPVKVASVAANGVTVTLGSGHHLLVPRLAKGALAANGAVTLGIRPEHLSLIAQGGVELTLNVQAVERLGSQTFLYGTLADGTWVTLEAPGETALAVGSQVSAWIDPAATHLFDSNEQALPRIGTL
jgi:multiple sugar transport system ATP-binding protein